MDGRVVNNLLTLAESESKTSSRVLYTFDLRRLWTRDFFGTVGKVFQMLFRFLFQRKTSDYF